MEPLSHLGLHHLQAVLAVHRVGSISVASQVLGISASQVSRYVAHVERELGVNLFDRHGPRLSTSRYGAELVPRIQRMADYWSEVSDLGKNLREGVAGEISIGYTLLTALTGLGTVLEAARKATPDVRLRLRCSPDDELEEAVAQGQVDMAILSPPIRTPALVLRSLSVDRFCLAIPSDWETGATIALDDPRVRGILTAPFENWPGTLNRFLNRCEELGVRPRLVPTVNDAVGRMALASSGLEVALVTEVRARMAVSGVRVVPLSGFEGLGIESAVATVRPASAPVSRILAEIDRALPGPGVD